MSKRERCLSLGLLVILVSLYISFTALAAYGTGVISLNGDNIWMGWTHFESSSEGYAQAGGDGGHAYGRYQLDIGYDFVDFMEKCVKRYPDHYEGFRKYISMSEITKGRNGNAAYTENYPLLNARASLSAYWKECAGLYTEEFSTLQDEFMYETYYLSAKRNLLAAGIDLNRFNDPKLNGTVWSISVRDGSGISNLKSITQTYKEGQTVEEWLEKIYDGEAAKHSVDRDRWQTEQREACRNMTDFGGTGGGNYVTGQTGLWSFLESVYGVWDEFMETLLSYITKLFHFPSKSWYEGVNEAVKITDKTVSAQALISIIDEACAAAYGKNYTAIYEAAERDGLDYNLTANTYTTNGNALSNIDYAYIMSVYSVGTNYYDTTLEKFRADMFDAMSKMTALSIEKKTTTVIEGVPFYKYKEVEVPVCEEEDFSEEVESGTDNEGKPTYTTEYYTRHTCHMETYYILELDENGQPIVDFRITSEDGRVVPDYQKVSLPINEEECDFVTDEGDYCDTDEETYFTIGPGDGTAGEGERTDYPVFKEVTYGDVTSSALSNSELWQIFGIDKDAGYFTTQAKLLRVNEEGEKWHEAAGWEKQEHAENEVTNFEVALFRYRRFKELYGEAFATAGVNYKKGLTSAEITQYLKALPDDISGNRKQVIKTALALVHQVSYCNNGEDSKPKMRGYDPSWYDYTRCDAMGRPSGLDSAGFIEWAFWTAGFTKEECEVLKTTALISNHVEEITEYDEMKPGDIGLVKLGVSDEANETYNRVGIYLGDGQWIVNSSTDNTVVISSSEGFSSVKVFSERLEDDDLYTDDIVFYGTGVAELGEGNLYAICQIILTEAGGSDARGIAAFAEMIKNRAVDNTEFGDRNTIWDVLTKDGEFESVNTMGYLSKVPTSRQLELIEQVFDSKYTVLNNAHVFYAARTKTHTKEYGTGDYAYNSLSVYETIGELTFYIEDKYRSFTGENGMAVYSNAYVDLSSYMVPANASNHPVVYMAQGDFADVAYGSGSVSSCGCGVVATAMAVSYCVGKTDKNRWISPQEVLALIERNKGSKEAYYVWGKGSSHDIAAAVAGFLNLPHSDVLVPSSLSEADVLRRLRAGQVAVCSASKGRFTSSGHFITLTGCDDAGNLYVNDPNGSHASYSYDKYNWAYMLDSGKGNLTSITFISPR